MYRLRKDNIIKETTDELKKDELILKGFELLDEKTKGKKENPAPNLADETSIEDETQLPKNEKGGKKNAK